MNEWRHVYDAARVRGATPEFKAASEALVAAAAQEPAQPDPRATLPPLEISGPAAEAADFVTGCVMLNRMQRHLRATRCPTTCAPSSTAATRARTSPYPGGQTQRQELMMTFVP